MSGLPAQPRPPCPLGQVTLDKWSQIQHDPKTSPLCLPAPNPFVPTDFSLACDRLPPVAPEEVVLPKLVSLSYHPLLATASLDAPALYLSAGMEQCKSQRA